LRRRSENTRNELRTAILDLDEQLEVTIQTERVCLGCGLLPSSKTEPAETGKDWIIVKFQPEGLFDQRV
jgi:hypothetical protein